MSKLDLKIKIETNDVHYLRINQLNEVQYLIDFNFKVTAELNTPPEDLEKFRIEVHNAIRRIRNLDEHSNLDVKAKMCTNDFSWFAF